MKSYQVKFSQKLPISLPEAWDFFSSPANLAKITPKEMEFIVTSEPPIDGKMYPGLIITYKVSPLFGIKLNWMTEITQVVDEKYFIDDNKPAISLTLPKTQIEYTSEFLFPLFFNMLSEGVNRKLQSLQLKIDEEDNFGLLAATAQYDTIGAITVKPIKTT